jgi:hypothetical protein
MTTGHELSAVVAILDTMSSETMCAADDTTLRKFAARCHITGSSWPMPNWRYARGPSDFCSRACD